MNCYYHDVTVQERLNKRGSQRWKQREFHSLASNDDAMSLVACFVEASMFFSDTTIAALIGLSPHRKESEVCRDEDVEIISGIGRIYLPKIGLVAWPLILLN